MLDLETLGTNYGAVITQIGACYFDRYTGEIGEKFQVNIDMEDSVREGFKIEPGSVLFWFDQPKKTFLENGLPVRIAMKLYGRFVRRAECVWSHATFDFGMIQDACHRLGMEQVMKYRVTKDIRTLMELADIHKDDENSSRENAHDALADCLYQVNYCVKAFNKIKK